MRNFRNIGVSTMFALLFACASISAQERTPSTADKQTEDANAAEKSNTPEALQKATQNPVANLIGVPYRTTP